MTHFLTDWQINRQSLWFAGILNFQKNIKNYCQKFRIIILDILFSYVFIGEVQKLWPNNMLGEKNYWKRAEKGGKMHIFSPIGISMHIFPPIDLKCTKKGWKFLACGAHHVSFGEKNSIKKGGGGGKNMNFKFNIYPCYYLLKTMNPPTIHCLAYPPHHYPTLHVHTPPNLRSYGWWSSLLCLKFLYYDLFSRYLNIFNDVFCTTPSV